MYYDSRNRALTPPQLAAIFAGARNRGISEKDVNKKKVITTLNDEIRLAQSRGEKDYKKAVDMALSKVYKTQAQVQIKDDVRLDSVGKSSKPDSFFDPEQLRIGTMIELEHTDDVRIARRIAKDHLEESKNYYKELQKMEKRLESERVIMPEKITPRGFSNEVIRKIAERQKELERKQQILIKVGKLQDERADLLQKQIEKTTPAEIESPVPPGLAVGSPPLQKPSEMPIFRQQGRIDTPAKLANAIESRTYAKIQSGIPPDIARDQARKEVLSIIQRNG